MSRDVRITEALSVVERSGRQALGDMQRLLGLLRSDHDEASELHGLADLARLADDTRAAGLEVDLTIAGAAEAVSPSAAATVYRVVQEGLTNTLRHAGARHATVGVEIDADRVEVEVVDDGGGTSSRLTGGGFGIAGLRERVILFNGTLQAGPTSSGWRLAATLPLPAGHVAATPAEAAERAPADPAPRRATRAVS
jgi:signal transduction histidine kinase